eukprot:3934796-Rhodomonas_salina.1
MSMRSAPMMTRMMFQREIATPLPDVIKFVLLTPEPTPWRPRGSRRLIQKDPSKRQKRKTVNPRSNKTRKQTLPDGPEHDSEAQLHEDADLHLAAKEEEESFAPVEEDAQLADSDVVYEAQNAGDEVEIAMDVEVEVKLESGKWIRGVVSELSANGVAKVSLFTGGARRVNVPSALVRLYHKPGSEGDAQPYLGEEPDDRGPFPRPYSRQSQVSRVEKDGAQTKHQTPSAKSNISLSRDGHHDDQPVSGKPEESTPDRVRKSSSRFSAASKLDDSIDDHEPSQSSLNSGMKSVSFQEELPESPVSDHDDHEGFAASES